MLHDYLKDYTDESEPTLDQVNEEDSDDDDDLPLNRLWHCEPIS